MAHIHFNMVITTAPNSHAQSVWAHPDDRHGVELLSPQYWADLGCLLERGKFDGLFFADTLAASDSYAWETIEAGGAPRPDPWTLLPLIASATRHLGLAATLSTLGTAPFLAVRRIGGVDNLSGGRVAWNVVTSYLDSDFAALGQVQTGHDERYDQADEFMDICYRLWDAFPRDALILDKGSGRYVDAGKMKLVEYAGKYHSCRAYPAMVCSEQGRPLIFQAGASPRGMQFAVSHADACFALQPRTAMRSYIEELEGVALAAGRPNPKVFFGVQPFIGDTQAEAEKRIAELEARVPIGTALNRLGGLLGRSFTEDDLDRPIAITETQASQGWMAAIAHVSEGEAPTLRELALHFAISPMTPRIVGTPEHVADTLEEWWRDTGCYGFTIVPQVLPDSMEAFADQVVPILQARGLVRTDYAGTTYRENLLQQSG